MYTVSQLQRLKKETGLPRGTFKANDPHPWLRGLLYYGWSESRKSKEIWRQPKSFERGREYRKENSSKINERTKAWESNNRDRKLRNLRDYKLRHKSEDSLRRREVRDFYKSLNDSDRALVDQFYAKRDELNKRDGKGKWHVDHILPLSKGGKHHPSNLQVVPAKWNLSKGNKSPQIYI